MGELESPHWYLLQFEPDPRIHVALTKVSEMPMQHFLDRLLGLTLASRRHEILLFIHGYNVTFEDGARRTAQLAYDLGQDVPVLYSWPSLGAIGAYPADEATADWTAPHLEAFLQVISEATHGMRINVIAHSMGNRPLIAALRGLATRNPRARFANLILTAPDIDRDTFLALAPRFLSLGERTTIYVSDHDRALMASRDFHRAPRAGEAGAGLLVLPGADTVDATATPTDFLDHSYTGTVAQ